MKNDVRSLFHGIDVVNGDVLGGHWHGCCQDAVPEAFGVATRPRRSGIPADDRLHEIIEGFRILGEFGYWTSLGGN